MTALISLWKVIILCALSSCKTRVFALALIKSIVRGHSVLQILLLYFANFSLTEFL